MQVDSRFGRETRRTSPWRAAHRQRIAYINVSCGQFPERTVGRPYPITDKEAGSIKSKMITCCTRAHSSADVAEMLQPALIICMSGPGYRALEKAKLVDKIPTIYFHQWQSCGLRLLRPITLAGVCCEAGSTPEQWLPLLSVQIASATNLV